MASSQNWCVDYSGLLYGHCLLLERSMNGRLKGHLVWNEKKKAQLLFLPCLRCCRIRCRSKKMLCSEQNMTSSKHNGCLTRLACGVTSWKQLCLCAYMSIDRCARLTSPTSGNKKREKSHFEKAIPVNWACRRGFSPGAAVTSLKIILLSEVLQISCTTDTRIRGQITFLALLSSPGKC